MQIDKSARSTVVVCTLPGCGTRELVSARPGADTAWIRSHLERAHPVRDAARDRVVAALSERERKRATRRQAPE